MKGIVEFAIWLSGNETESHMAHFVNVVIPQIARDTEHEHNIILGDPSLIIKHPGEERVPPVPDHIHGINVRLLVVEWPLLARKEQKIHRQSGFVLDLEHDDLQKLRAMTRKAHAKTHPGDRLSDKQCDAIIEYLGPEAAMKTLRDGSAIN